MMATDCGAAPSGGRKKKRSGQGSGAGRDKRACIDTQSSEAGGEHTEALQPAAAPALQRVPVVLVDFPVEHLHPTEEIVAQGWSGTIMLGCVEGERAAIKVAPYGSERAKAFINEARAYKLVKKLWGTHVVRLLGFGTTCKGRVVWLATQLASGRHPSPTQPDAPAVVKAARKSLRALHARGISHGDVSHKHILVQQGDSGAKPVVLLLDLGFAGELKDRKEAQHELNRLRNVLAGPVKNRP